MNHAQGRLTRPRRPVALSLVLLAAAAALSCFEFAPPIAERLEIRLLPDGRASVLAEVSLADPSVKFKENPRVQARLDDEAQTLLSGRDPWSRAFSRTDLTRDFQSWERRGGHLVLFRRGGELSGPEALETFLGSLDLAASLGSSEGVWEFGLAPGAASRATAEQRVEFRAAFDSWSAAIADYLEAGRSLYDYLESHPDRARTCLGAIYEGWVDKAETGDLPEPNEEEQALLEKLSAAMGQVLEVLQTPKDSAYSPDELSRLACDPLPGLLEVEVPGAILKTEGFEEATSNRVVYRGVCFWEVFRMLEGRWLKPDLILPVVPFLLEDPDPPKMSLAALVARPRRSEPSPSREALRRILEEALRPPSTLIVRWQPATGAPGSSPK